MMNCNYLERRGVNQQIGFRPNPAHAHPLLSFAPCYCYWSKKYEHVKKYAQRVCDHTQNTHQQQQNNRTATATARRQPIKAALTSQHRRPNKLYFTPPLPPPFAFPLSRTKSDQKALLSSIGGATQTSSSRGKKGQRARQGIIL